MTQNNIKKSIFILVGIFALFVSGCANQNRQEVPLYDTVNVVENLVINENSVPIFPKKAALTTDMAQHFALDLPKRCTVNWNNQSVVSVIPEETIEIVRLNVGDELPD